MRHGGFAVLLRNRRRTEAEVLYNTAHIRTRNVVERLFGTWKRHFPCLQRGLLTKIETSLAICATAVLYNIGLRENEVVEDNLIDEVPVIEISKMQNWD
ncbi:hypothetical protein NQ315_000519 [Exocentrus adspersus]|uniref:DDE Tnp4 domain-containing protein n=1 Tax=Exocentrus adspersus TaxID=1586481 RepID=A0AAV8VDW5_9CUCU|nr:hypothetical protein NQ315_000519 [Exocentrus adspersus]